jgi:hypothetical protein
VLSEDGELVRRQRGRGEGNRQRVRAQGSTFAICLPLAAGLAPMLQE